MVNPYAFSGPVRDPAMFFGRTELRQEILDGLRSGQSFAITGTVRIGRSSLLFQLRHALLEQLKAPGRAALVPILIRNRDFPKPSLSLVCQRIVEEFDAASSTSAMGDDWRRGLRLFRANLDDNQIISAFDEALVAVVRARGADARIVLMIDDVDRLSQHGWSRALFDELRQLIHGGKNSLRMTVVLTGDFVAWSSHEPVRSPFPDTPITMKTLGVLSRKDTEELVVRPTGIDRKSSVVSSMVFETGGHPFLAKYLMNKLLDEVDGDLTKATPERVQAIVGRYLDERADFRQWTLRFTDGDRRAYDLMASDSGATRDDLVRGLGGPQQTSRAIQVLVQTGVVREEPAGSERYFASGDMFRRWFYLFSGPALGQPGSPPGAVLKSPPPARRPSDEIQFTVYRPNVLRPGEWKTMLAFMHLANRRPDAPRGEPGPAEQVQALARQALGKQASLYDHNRAESAHSVPRESEITLVPVVPGLEFRPDRRTFLWIDDIHQEQFTVRARPEADGTVARGRLSAFLGVILLAEVDISIRVDSAHPADQRDEPKESSTARLYRRVFASYSRKDAEIVRQFELFVQSLGDVYLRDVHDIKPGMDWRTRLRELIQEADVFQLFWSNNAMQSSHVRAEWEYALSLNRPGFVRPTYWEDPFPESPAQGLPPEELRQLHFHRLGGSGSSRLEAEIEAMFALAHTAMAKGDLERAIVALSMDVLSANPVAEELLAKARAELEQRTQAARLAEAPRVREAQEVREPPQIPDAMSPIALPPRPGAILQPSPTPELAPAPASRSHRAWVRVVVAVLVLIGVMVGLVLI